VVLALAKQLLDILGAPTKMTKIALDGNDRLFLFGYGLFETLKVTSLGIELLDSHWQRMNQGSQLLSLSIPTYQEWIEQINNFISQRTYEYPYALRVTLSGGSPTLGIQPQLYFNTREIPYTLDDYEQGFRVVFLSTARSENSILTKIKSTNYLENILAREEALKSHAQEGLWTNTQGYITEGTISNVFFIKNNVLYTPSLECGCLAGTRRNVVLQLASDLGISVQEGKYQSSLFKEADHVFLTNALMGIMPVSHIDSQLKNIQSTMLKTLIDGYNKHVKRLTG